ncbi:MAG: hypothetical protein ABIO91_08510 [Pyrinomonadaceae bacterium]
MRDYRRKKEAVSPTPKTETNSAASQEQRGIISEADKRRNENIQKAKEALADGYDQKNDKFGRLDAAEKLVSDIGYFDKQYDEAQDILKEVKRRRDIIASIPTPKEKALKEVQITTSGSKGGFGTVLLVDVAVKNPTDTGVKI